MERVVIYMQIDDGFLSFWQTGLDILYENVILAKVTIE